MLSSILKSGERGGTKGNPVLVFNQSPNAMCVDKHYRHHPLSNVREGEKEKKKVIDEFGVFT